MEAKYFVILRMRTIDGIMEFGRFYLGINRDFAMETFKELHGKRDRHGLIFIDLAEVSDKGEAILESLTCTIDELSLNDRRITCDVFKYFNLEK